MFFEIIIFFSYFVFCLFSIIGYGIIFKKLLFCTNDQNLGELGFFGFFFLFFISLFFHFFIPLSYWFNLIVLLIGLCIFIINFSIIKNEIILIRKSFFLFSIIILPALFFIKIPADFETYHLPYVNYLNNFKIIFGLVNLSNNYAYGHGWLDILGFFSVPIIENRGISLIALLFLYFFFLYLITEIKQTKLKSVKIYSILAIVYSFANFNKVENLAAEVQPTLLILILILHILKFLNNTSVNETFMKIIFYSFYALILRIGSLIILPIVLVIIIININKIIKICFNYLKLNFFILVFLLILLSKNFILTGCFVYPLYWTCPDNNITWANPIENVKERFEFISAISKRWKFYILEEANLNNELEYYEPMEKNIILSPKLYNHNKFFWLKYWSKDHDVKRLLNAFLIVLFCYLSFFIFAKNKFIILSSLIVRPKKNNLIHLGIILSILMWFFLSPQMRYGGYGIIGGGLIFFSSLILSKYIIPKKQFIAVSIFLFFISSSFFLSKNIPRITKNVFINDKSNISLWPLYKNKTIGKDYKKVIKNGVKLNLILTPKNIIKDPVQCGNLKMLCLPEERIVCISNIDINKGYYFISNKNNKCLLQFKKNYWQH